MYSADNCLEQLIKKIKEILKNSKLKLEVKYSDKITRILKSVE